MRSGFVFIINNKQPYLGLLNIAMDSVLSFSDRDIEVFSVNFNYMSNNSRVRVIRIDSPEDFESMCFLKFRVLIESSFDTAVYLDSDVVVSRGVDNIFSFANNITKYPLLPLHCGEPGSDIHGLMNALGASIRTQHYVHADFYLSNRGCHDFLRECQSIAFNMKRRGIHSFAGDEGLINIALWKHGVTKEFLPRLDDGWKAFEKRLGIYDWTEDISESKFYICHGCKDVEKANRILDGLKKINGDIR